MPAETLQTTVRLRPTRIGFVVDPADGESVLGVMRYCTGLWGGRFNPIIPNSRRLPKAWRSRDHPRPSGFDLCSRYISFFEPDVFITATDRPLPLGYEDDKLIYPKQRTCSIEDFVAGDDQHVHDFTFGINMIDVYNNLYHEEFKFVQRHEQSFVRVDHSMSADPFFTAVAGVFPSDNNLSYLVEGYDDIFNPAIVNSDASIMEKLIKREVYTPLGLTNFLIDISTWRRNSPLIFIFNPDVPADLIDYWNLRITVRHVIPVNMHWFEQVSGLIHDIIERNYRPLPGNPHGVMIRTTLEFASSIGEEQAKSLTEGLRDLPQGSWSLKLWYTPLWDRHDDEFIQRPSKARLTAASKDAELLFTDDSLNAWVETLSPPFAQEYGGPYNSARWVNVLGLRSIHRDSPLALCFPIKSRIVDFPKLITLHQALMSREGIVLFQEYKNHRDLLKWMRGREAIIAWLDAHGVEATPSDAGRTAGEIINAVGDLRGVRLFAHEGTIHKLNDMASRRVREHGESTKEYPDRTASVTDWKSIVSRRSNKSRSGPTELDDFVRANVLRLGLAIPCTHCQKTNWYGLDDLSTKLVCVRCLSTFPFPQGEVDPKRTPWHFRVVGPFSVPDFASGGYATALTLRLFARGLRTTDVRITYATGLDLKFDQLSIEVDFVLWFQKELMFRDSTEPVTLFGETKSYANGAFSRKDIDRLKTVARRFPGSFLVLSCLKDELSKAEKDRIRGLAEWGRLPDSAGRPRAPVIVLLGGDLFFEWGLREAWEARGGTFANMVRGSYRDLTHLWNLADITQGAYLEMPPYDEWWHKRYEAQRRRRMAARAKASSPAAG